jgi:hypothetical protein
VLYYVAKYGRVGDAVVAVAPAILIPISTSAYVSAAIASKLTPRKRVKATLHRGADEARYGKSG